MANGHRRPGQKDGEREKETTNPHVSIEPGVKLDFVDHLKKQYDAERTENKAAQDKQLRWTKIAAALVFVYTAFSGYQACVSRQTLQVARDTFNAANRPYVGVAGFGISHTKRNAAGEFETVPHQDKDTHWLNITADIKNFGPVPGTNFRSNWNVFMDGIEQKATKTIDKPTTIFPTQVVHLAGQVGSNDYPYIMNGRKILTVEVTVEYDGPAGRYKDCYKGQFGPEVNNFYRLGPCP